jgi:membrane-associated phospholipid phosphatase
VEKSQHALFDTVTTFVAAHEQAAIALGGLFVAAAVFGVGWGYRHNMSTWLATSARVGGLLFGVTVLALEASCGGWLTGVDQSATAWLFAHRNSTLDHVALAVSTVLGPVELALLTTAGAVAVGIKLRSALGGLTVPVTVGGASALCWLIKLLVARPRPPLVVQETLETDYSFPSGHVTGTAALVGILAVAFGLAASRVVKGLLAVVTVLAVSVAALSRLYLGVHWLTDVTAGVLLAAAVVTVGATALAVLVNEAAPLAAKPPLPRSPQEGAATSLPNPSRNTAPAGLLRRRGTHDDSKELSTHAVCGTRNRGLAYWVRHSDR